MTLPDGIAILGDPHLGRVFKNNVPLHRLGEREAGQWERFKKSLLLSDTSSQPEFHVCMGDLFDKFTVPYDVVLRAAELYELAANLHGAVEFIVLRGNHDVSRDSSRRSAFDVFTKLVSHVENIHVIDSVEELYLSDGRQIGFVPYDVFTPVADQIEELDPDLDAVFMHHDYVDFGGDYVIPTKQLAEKGITTVVNGHDHLRRVEERHGVTVNIVGSMEPFTHAEDPDGSMYITVPLHKLGEIDVTNKNVRVLLQEGESLPTDLDCLSLTAKPMDDAEEDEGIEVDTSDFEALDLRALLARSLDGLTIQNQVMEAFDDGS